MTVLNSQSLRALGSILSQTMDYLWAVHWHDTSETSLVLNTLQTHVKKDSFTKHRKFRFDPRADRRPRRSEKIDCRVLSTEGVNSRQ